MSHLMLYAINDFYTAHKELIFVIVIGAISGYIAESLIPGRGFGLIFTIALGIGGSFLGDWLFKDYLNFTHNPLIDLIIRSVAGAMILCIGLNLILGNRQGKREKEKDVYDYENE